MLKIIKSWCPCFGHFSVPSAQIMSDKEQQPPVIPPLSGQQLPLAGNLQQEPPVNPPEHHASYFKLLDFCPASPHAWFGIVDGQF